MISFELALQDATYLDGTPRTRDFEPIIAAFAEVADGYGLAMSHFLADGITFHFSAYEMSVFRLATVLHDLGMNAIAHGFGRYTLSTREEAEVVH